VIGALGSWHPAMKTFYDTLGCPDDIVLLVRNPTTNIYREHLGITEGSVDADNSEYSMLKYIFVIDI
jgi:hypothetical protein